MNYALAHDENGTPLTVPATANGWLVRRHGGGRGRPASVYDADGRPLVVPLESTAGDLRAFGCKAGTYRLDAVDSSRQPLGVVAYTELSRGQADEAEGMGSSGPSDASVAALARVVEAMQRVQAERERAQAERERAQNDMICRLIERLAPPVAQAPRNAPELLREFGDVQKQLQKLLPEGEEEIEETSSKAADVIAGVIENVTKQIMPIVMMKIGGVKAPPTASSAEKKTEASKDDDAPAAGETEQSQPISADKEEVDRKLTAVFALLTPGEAALVRNMSTRMPQSVVEQVLARLLTMTPEEAVAELRRLFLKTGKTTAADAPANGTSADESKKGAA